MLHEALMSLIADKGYEPITINEICERANVGRSTFYAHYAGKDDLMRSGLDDLRDIAMESQIGGSAQGSLRRGGLAFSLMMLEHARDHVHLHKRLGERGGTIAHDTVRKILSDLVRSELAAAASENPKNAMPRELVVQYVVGAYMAVATWWLDGGARLAPQQVDAVFQRLAIEGIAGLS
jgi:AcrR family transcriptional regulator